MCVFFFFFFSTFVIDLWVAIFLWSCLICGSVIFFPSILFFLRNTICGYVIRGGWLWSLVILCMGLCKMVLMRLEIVCGVFNWGRLVVDWC